MAAKNLEIAESWGLLHHVSEPGTSGSSEPGTSGSLEAGILESQVTHHAVRKHVGADIDPAIGLSNDPSPAVVPEAFLTRHHEYGSRARDQALTEQQSAIFPRILLDWRRKLGGSSPGVHDKTDLSVRGGRNALGSRDEKAGGEKGAASTVESWLWVFGCVAGLLVPLAILFFSLTTNRARLDSSQLWGLSPSMRSPVVAWERPGCILTLDSRYNPEGVRAVEAAVARLLRDLGAEGEGVGGEGVGREGVGAGVGDKRQEGRRGKSRGMQEIQEVRGKRGKRERDGEGRWYGGRKGRRLKGGGREGKGENEKVKERGRRRDEMSAKESKGGEKSRRGGEGRQRKGEGRKSVGDNASFSQEGEQRQARAGEGGEQKQKQMPEVWRRLYEGLPKMLDLEGNEVEGKMPIWVTLAVNMLYARRHGYRLVAESGSKYTQDRHPSWFKVPFLEEQLSCCCQWAFFLDSDAYMRMKHHRLSVHDWVQVIREPNYFSWLFEANLTDSLDGQVWVPQDPALLLQPATALQPEGPVALIPRNGDSRGGYVGGANMLFKAERDYINAGVMLWRRSPDSFKFFKEWYNVTEDEYHRYNHVWEQSNLNRVAREERWRGKVVVVPYRELTGPEGEMVRHVWGSLPKEAHERVVYEALEEALGLP
ncbi:hypothetical protein CLOM_g13118 [Closterium sp. NIES-68]|nr:hypothetical protein CLOM_g22727 [Closterium sp. NIES-68]GJP54005.1 hypothetical protein CLOM_g13118 [Closterium sp. NIES-68]GJP60537.1 hypothetical protein CLOP_g17780 [Closterium sp. NIES-67]